MSDQFWPGFFFGFVSATLMFVVAAVVLVHLFTSNRQGDY